MTAERAVGEVTRRKESGTWGRRAVWFLCFGLGLLTCPLSLVPVVMLLGLGCLGVGLLWGTAPLWGIFGVGVLLLPLLGNGALLTLGFITLAVHGRGEVAPRFAVPFTLVVGANVIGAFAVALFTLSAVPLEGRGLVDLLQIARASTPHLWGALVGGLNLLLFLGIFSVLRIDSVAQRAMLRGLWGGALLAACLIAAALLGPEVLTLPNTSDLWRSLGRHSGTFTDPNAFGVATVLLIAILLGSGMAAHELRVRLLGVSLATVWCALAVVSGSRSFFLGLGVLVLLSVGRWAPRLLVAGLVLAAGGVCLLQTFELPSGQLPIGLERLVQSLRFDRVAETFHSRGVFWSIAASVSGEYPWFGVGLGGFATVVEPYAHALGIPLNGWTDNANSYYLGLVAEMGLVGLFAWLISVRRLQWGRDPRGAVWFGRGVVALLVMLIVGPHLDFAEVTILAAVCVAASPIIDRFPSGNVPHGGVWSNWIIAAVIFSGIVGARLNSEQGQFPFERDGEGRFQWTTTRAVIQRECRARKTTLTVRSAHPDIVHTPVRVRVRVPFGEEQLILDSNAARTIELPCALERTPEWATPSAIDIALEVDRGWVPAHHGGGNDYRYLGVQVRENRSP